MASEVEICNRALQKLGAKRITALSDDSPNARSCNAAYTVLRDAELRKHTWAFSITRAELAADSPAPTWGRANAFTLPTDFLKLADPYPEDNTNARDWLIEQGKIITDESDPLYIRYVARITDPNAMDTLFREALSCAMAFELCEEITQSNTKKEAMRASYTAIIREAKRANALDNVPVAAVEDDWLSVRR